MSLPLSPICSPRLFPTLGAFFRIILHLFPPCPSHLGALGHESTLVFHLFPTCLPLWVPWAAWIYSCLPPCLPFWVPWAAWVYTLVLSCVLLVSHTISHSGCLGLHEFELISHTCLPLWVPWAAWAYTCNPHLSPTLDALGCMSLHLSPTLVSRTCLPLWVPWAALAYTCLPHLSPTLGALGCMSLHWSPTLVSHSGCLEPQEFTLDSHLSPTLGFLGRMSLYLFSTCFPYLSPICLPLVSHLFHADMISVAVD